MGALLGPVGGLEMVASPTSEPVEAEPRFSFTTFLSGRRQAQMFPAPPRDWSCTVGTVTPEDSAVLEWMASGHLFAMSGGLVWYSSYSQVTNMLTPAESHMGFTRKPGWTGGAAGGAGRASDGTRYLVSRTADVGGQIGLTEPLPAPSQSPVSVSAYVSTHPTSGATLRVTELDPEGAAVGAPHVAPVLANQHAIRPHVSFTTSVRTVTLRIEVVGALMVTMPAVTLTREVQPWAVGRGCRHAVVQISGEDPQLAFEVAHDWGRRHGSAFTIHELG